MKYILNVFLVVAIICIVIYFSNYIIKEKVYAKPYNEYIKAVSQKYDIDENLIYAIMKVESKFDKNATSNSNAKGLMQIIDSTGKEVSKKIGIDSFESNMLYNPKINIEIGTMYFKELVNKYLDFKLALVAYNAGQGNVDKWIEEGIIKGNDSLYNLPYVETSMYLQKVLREYNAYNKIY